MQHLRNLRNHTAAVLMWLLMTHALLDVHKRVLADAEETAEMGAMFTAVTVAREIQKGINITLSRNSIILRRKINIDVAFKFLNAVEPILRRGICIDLYLDSRGGDVSAALLLARFLAGRSHLFSTYNIGKVDSASILLFVAADSRVAVPGSSFFVHQLSMMKEGEPSSSGDEIITKLTEDVCRFVGNRIAIDKVIWRNMMHEGVVLSEHQALGVGLVKELRNVLPPRKTICI